MKFHEMSDAQFAAYSRSAERNQDIDDHRSRKTLERHAEAILTARPKTRGVYPARVLAIAAEALEIAEVWHGGEPILPAVVQEIARHLLAEAGIEPDEFTP